MKKYLALVLAVLMTASLSVVGMAEDSGIVPYGGGGGDYATMLNGKTPYDTVYIEMPVEDPKGTGVLVTLDIAEICEDKDNWRAIPSNSTNRVFYFSKSTRVLKNGWAHYQCRIKPLGSTKVEVGDVLEDTLSISLIDGDRSFQETFTINMTIVEGTVTPPDKPTPDPKPDRPNPGTPNGTSSDKDEPSPTENAANDDKTLDKLAAGESAEVKLTSGSAALSTDTMDTLGGHSGKLTVTVDKMTVAIPGGFGKVTEPGRIYYPLDFTAAPANAADLAAAVKGEKAKTEVVKAGGDMVMPTTVTVTLKTRLTGTVNVYYYNPETRRYTLIASPVAKDGKITFTTKQMGHMVLTTGTI